LHLVRSCQRAAGWMRAVMAASCQKKPKRQTPSWHTEPVPGDDAKGAAPLGAGTVALRGPTRARVHASRRELGTRDSSGHLLGAPLCQRGHTLKFDVAGIVEASRPRHLHVGHPWKKRRAHFFTISDGPRLPTLRTPESPKFLGGFDPPKNSGAIGPGAPSWGRQAKASRNRSR
jgi:hypothetical protein